MKHPLLVLVIFLFSVAAISAQKTNDAIAKQIKSLKADKQITLTYDSESNASKIMATAGNFDAKEASTAGIQAMNFGIAFTFAGQKLTSSPEKVNLTFWVLSKKPRFADAHGWGIPMRDFVKIADSRYVAKPAENMEYLNFQLTWDEFRGFVSGVHRKPDLRLGSANFTFTPAHIALFDTFLEIGDIN